MKKEPIILLGCGQHARVVIYNIAMQNKYEIVGILDIKDRVGELFEGLPILGTDSDSEDIAAHLKVKKFFVGFGNMKRRESIFRKYKKEGWTAVNIIHPDAIVSKTALIGEGVLVECGCLITPNPIIGDNVVINTGSQVNHDNIVRDHAYIASGVILSGGVTIGKNTLLDDGVIVTLGKTVGENCIIGAGSVVTKNIEDGMIAYGNPCKPVRRNE